MVSVAGSTLLTWSYVGGAGSGHGGGVGSDDGGRNTAAGGTAGSGGCFATAMWQRSRGTLSKHDPVTSCTLCADWEEFPTSAYVDNAVHSDLDEDATRAKVQACCGGRADAGRGMRALGQCRHSCGANRYGREWYRF